MKKIIGITFLILLLGVIIIPFTNITLADPIALKVTSEDNKIPTKQGLYCADSLFLNKCIGGEDSTPEVVEMDPGSTIKFNFAKKPDELQVIQKDNEGNEEDRRSYMKDDKNEIIVPEKSGIHQFSIEAKWDDKNRSAFYFFSVKVK